MFSDEIFQKLSFTFLLGFGFVCVRFERNLADSAVQKCFKSACTQRPKKKGDSPTHTAAYKITHRCPCVRTQTHPRGSIVSLALKVSSYFFNFMVIFSFIRCLCQCLMPLKCVQMKVFGLNV